MELRWVCFFIHLNPNEYSLITRTILYICGHHVINDNKIIWYMHTLVLSLSLRTCFSYMYKCISRYKTTTKMTITKFGVSTSFFLALYSWIRFSTVSFRNKWNEMFFVVLFLWAVRVHFSYVFFIFYFCRYRQFLDSIGPDGHGHGNIILHNL